MKLALGTVQLGMDYGVQGGKRPPQEIADEILSFALENNINHFDTAAAYGNAEEVLGKFIKRNPNKVKDIHIVSKLAPMALDGAKKNQQKEIVLREVSKSIRKLNVNGLDAFLFHNAKYIFDEEAIYALECVKREGMAGKIGVSIYTPQEAMKALEYNEVTVIQVPYNVFDQRLDQCGFFEQARKKEIEIYARSSLLQGLMLMSPDCLPVKMRFAEKYLIRFLSICNDYHISPLKAAVCYVKEHSGIDHVVFGVDNKEQLLEYSSMWNEQLPDDLACILQNEFENVEEKLVNPVLWNS